MLSGCIVIYNSNICQLLNTCQNAISNSCLKKLFVIDLSNRSQFDLFPIKNKKIEYIELNRNIGFGAAHNIGINYSIAQGFNFHVILNPDLEFNETCLNDLYSIISEDPEIGLIQPRILNTFGIIQDSCRLLPTPFNLFIRLFPFSKYFNNRYELKNFKFDKVANIPYLSGCFMLINNNVINQIGLFDDRFFLYAEDIDFSRRIHLRYKTIFYPYVTIKHFHNKTSFKSLKYLFIHTQSVITYFNKWGWFFDDERKCINNSVLSKIFD